MPFKKELHADYFFRKFHRGNLVDDHGNISSNAQKTADLDYKADQQFQEQNFVDHFGTLLRSDPAKWRQIDTYDKVCTFFWGKNNQSPSEGTI